MNDQIRGIRQAALLAAALAGGLLQAVSAAETVDNFTDASNWGAPIPMEGSGGLAFANGRLNFTSPSTGNAGAAIARKGPSLPFDQSWSLQVDVHLDPVALTTDGQFSDVFLAVGKAGDEVNTLVMYEFGRGLWGAPGGYYLGDTVNVNGKKVEDKRFGGGLLNLTAAESALRLDYDGATHTLTYTFDEDGPTAGYQWTPQETVNLASGTCNLGMSASDTFTIILVGSSASQTVDVGQAYWSNLVITTGTVAPTAPTITGQPLENTIAVGQTETLWVDATGTEPLSYQWYQGVSGDTNTPMANATNRNFTTPALSATTRYWVRVSNEAGVADSVGAFVYVPLPVVLLGSYDTPDWALGVQVVGTTAYVADAEAGLQILDVSNPASVVRLGSYDTPGSALGVQVMGTTAYVADAEAGLQILDVSNPANVVRLGGYDTPGWTLGLQVVGTTAYMADGGSGLQILDVSNPANVVQLGSCDTPSWAVNVQVVGTTAYVADGGSGLQILDVSNPANVLRLGAYATSYAKGVQVVGTTAYVADRDLSLHILDVRNPANVVQLGSCGTPGFTQAAQVAGTTAYVTADTAGLWILDVRNPTDVVRLGGYNTPGSANGVQVVGTTAYVADGGSGLQILDVSAFQPPAAPPSILTGDGSLGVSDGRFGFRFAVPAGQTFVLEASTNLAEWMPLRTNISDGLPVAYTDPQWTNYVGRFYRVRVP